MIQDGSPGHAHVRLATQFATALNARLHVIRIVDALYDEGKLLSLAFGSPFEGADAVHALRNELAGTGTTPEFHLSLPRRLGDVLARVDADIVFLDAPRWTGYRWLRRRMLGMLDRLPCPVICADSAGNELGWSLRRPFRRAAHDILRFPAVAASPLDPIETDLVASGGSTGERRSAVRIEAGPEDIAPALEDEGTPLDSVAYQRTLDHGIVESHTPGPQ